MCFEITIFDVLSSTYGATYGIIGYLGPNGVVKNLGVENMTVDGGNKASRLCIGGIAGTTKDKDGTYISGCYNYGSVATTATNKGMVGGIAGKCLKPVSDCYNYGTITASRDLPSARRQRLSLIA